MYQHGVENWISIYYSNTNITATVCIITFHSHTSPFVWQYLIYLCHNKLMILCVIAFQGLPTSISFRYRGNKRRMKIKFRVTKMLKSLCIPKLTMFFIFWSFCYSLVRIEFASILHTLTWTKHAISKVFQTDCVPFARRHSLWWK